MLFVHATTVPSQKNTVTEAERHRILTRLKPKLDDKYNSKHTFAGHLKEQSQPGIAPTNSRGLGAEVQDHKHCQATSKL